MGAVERPCVILMVGSRSGPEGRYPVSELAARYGASVAEETSDSNQPWVTGVSPDPESSSCASRTDAILATRAGGP